VIDGVYLEGKTLGNDRSLSLIEKILRQDNGDRFLRDFWKAYSYKYVNGECNDTPRQIKPCKLWTGARENGYPVQGCGKGLSKMKMHQLSLYVATGQVNSPGVKARADTSHDCHTKRCIEPSHLSIVSKQTNRSKQGCLSFVWGADFDEDWKHFINVCPHTPVCLKRDSKNNKQFRPMKSVVHKTPIIGTPPDSHPVYTSEKSDCGLRKGYHK
jgi:hypothetical protein